jgi:uncharacterized protein involved in outer membrane biogenesis
MPWKKIIVVLATLFVLVLLAAYAVVVMYDFNKLKPRLAQAVKAATGRELTIDGDLKFKLGFFPTLSAGEIRFQNPSWAFRPDLATVKRIDLQLALLPLLHGTLEFRKLTLIQPDVILEVDPAGNTNFDFPTSGQSGLIPIFNLAFTDAQVEQGRFTYRGPESASTFVIGVDRLHTTIPGLNDPVKLELDATYLGKPCEVKGTFVPLATLFEPNRPWPVDLTGQTPAGTTVHVDGEIRDVVDFSDLRLHVTAEGSSFPDIFAYFGVQDIPDLGPFKLDAKLADPDEKLALESVAAHVGTQDLVMVDVAGTVRNLIGLRGVDLRFNVEGTEQKNLVKLGWHAPIIRGPFDAQGRITDPTAGIYRFNELAMTAGPYKVYGSLEVDVARNPQRLVAQLSSDHLFLGPAHLDVKILGPVTEPSVESLNFLVGSPDTAEITISGKIPHLLTPEDMDFTFSAVAGNLTNLETVLGQPLPIQGALSAAGKISMPKAEVLRIPNLRAKLAKLDLTGSVDLDLSGQEPILGLALSSPRFNLQNLLKQPIAGLPGLTRVPDLGPMKLDTRLTRLAKGAAVEKINLQVGDQRLMQLRVQGKVDDLLTPKGLQIGFDAAGNDVSQLERLTGQSLPLKGAFALSGRISDTATRVFKVDDLNLAMGKNRLTGTIAADFTGRQPTIETHLAAGSFNLQPLTSEGLAGLTRIPDLGPLTLDAKLTSRGQMLSLEKLQATAGTADLLDLKLNGSVKNLTTLSGINLEFQAGGQDVAELQPLIGQRLPLSGAYTVSGTVSDPAAGGYRVDNLQLVLGPNTLQGSLDLNVSTDHPQVALALSSPSLSLKPLTVGQNQILQTLARLPDLGPLDLSLTLVKSPTSWGAQDIALKAGTPSLAKLQLSGSVKDLAGLQGIDALVALGGTDARKLEQLIGESSITAGAYSLSGRLERPAPTIYRVEDLKMAYGKSDLAGRVAVDTSRSRPFLDLDLTSRYLDLRPLFREVVASNKPEAGPSQTHKGKRIFSDAPLPFEQLNRFDATMKLKVGKLLSFLYVYENILLPADLKDGTLTAGPAQFQTAGGSGEISTKIQSRGTSGLIGLSLRLEEIEIGPMLETLGYAHLLDGKLEEENRFSASGTSLAELMANLNGTAYIAMDRGNIDLKYLGLLQTDLFNSLNRILNPFQKKESYTDFNCLVSQFDVKDGLATVKMLLDTEQTSIVAAGDINLKSEGLNIGIKPSPKQGFGVSGIGRVTIGLNELTKPFKLGGTLANPSLAINPTQSMLAIGKALGGLALLGPFGVLTALADVSIGDKHACLKAIETARSANDGQQKSAAQPESAAKPAKQGFFGRLFGW